MQYCGTKYALGFFNLDFMSQITVDWSVIQDIAPEGKLWGPKLVRPSLSCFNFQGSNSI